MTPTELLSSLIAIPSFPREEKDAADYMQAFLEGEGFGVHRTGNNLWMESCAPDGRPTILLNAHIDTVRPSSGYTRDPFRATLERDCLYGLGSNDCGGSLVTLLEAYRILSARPQPYRLVYSVTAEEEVGGTGGIETIFPEIGTVDLGIIGEPTGMNMAVAEKGLMVLDCTARGKSAHAARNEGVNAIYKALEDIEWFRTYRFPKVSEHCGEVKMTVTQINAGTQHNVVPDSCTFVVDIRGNGIYRNLDILEVVEKNVKCEFKPRSTRHNGAFIDTSHPVVQRGLSLSLGAFGSPTTSNQSVCPFTTLKIGPGDSSRSHTADEYIRLSEMEAAVDIYVKLLDNLDISYGK